MTLRHCVREAQNGNHEATLFLLGQFLIFEGKELYITTQFFEDEREKIIQWYKKHINKDT